MKICDIQRENTCYDSEQKTPEDIARLKYPQKYIILELGDEVYDLEIRKVTDTAIYVGIIINDGKAGVR